MGKLRSVSTPVFLALAVILYILILTTGGTLLVASSFGAIVLCFLYALLQSGDKWILAALACTVGADLCLVVCDPVQRLWGMMFFLAAQSLYALRLYRKDPCKTLLLVRVVLILLIEGIAVLVLREKTDALALISVCYYANLILNIVAAFRQFRSKPIFPIALVLFLLCDTVIGLQVAVGGYLPIGEDSWLYRLIFMNFNLSWFFYLPSQVLIALSSKK